MMTDPRVRPVATGAEVVLVAEVLRENGLAEAAGFPKPKPKPVEGAVEAAGAPEKKTSGNHSTETGLSNKL